MKKLRDLSDKRKKLSYEELNKFFITLYTYIKSGVPLVDAIELLSRDNKNKKYLIIVRDNLIKGNSVSQSIEETGVFPMISIFLIKAGETSGRLDQSLLQMAEYYGNLDKIKTYVKNVLIYPIILLVSVLFLILYINFHFIPSMEEIFVQDNLKLNLFSSIVIKISRFLNFYGKESLIIVSSFLILPFFIVTSFITEEQRVHFMINFPLFGNIYLNNIWLNIFFSYSLMFDSGVDIVTSSNLIGKYISNSFIKKKIDYFINNINSGKSISDTLKELKLKDENIIYFITLGERTGNIKENIDILKNMYVQKSEKDYKTLVNFLQPFLILVITFILGITMFAVLIPMLDYASDL